MSPSQISLNRAIGLSLEFDFQVQLTPSQLDGRPLLAFFESGAPTFFPSDLGSLALSEDILAWAGNIIEGGSIEYIDSSTLARVRNLILRKILGPFHLENC